MNRRIYPQAWLLSCLIRWMVACSLIVVVPEFSAAQTRGTQGTNGNLGSTAGSEDHSATDLIPGTSKLTPYITSSIVRDIRAVQQECGRYDPVYRVDCLQQGFALVAKRIPRTGEYRQIKQAIEGLSRDLGRIVSANADTARPRQASTGNARFKVRRSYRAIKKQNLRKALHQAEAAIRKTETILLRSSENSEKRYQHYQQVATAVGSTKVLLRSA